MHVVSPIAKPKLSVVVASQNARESVGDCLRSLKNQCSNGKIEIIVVDNSTDETAEIVKREFPSVRFVAVDKKRFIPQLWGIGIAESAGEYVALTTSHFVPSETWLTEILKAHEQPFSGIGGAIENEEKAGLVSWAIYFCRYSPYMLPFNETEVEDFAADNASYKRRDLERVKDAMRDGFWEVFVHQEMRRAGMKLAKTPEVVVYHQKSFTFSGFMNQRFHHGRQFGESRAAKMSASRRTMMILLSPTIPLIYLFRITRRVFDKKRNIGKFFASLPILILFLLSWSSGEFSGYLRSSGTK